MEISYNKKKTRGKQMYNINFKVPIHIHFIGIGGISMSSLAEILLHQGFQVSGSDTKESALTSKLRLLGAQIFIGQSGNNLSADVSLVIYTAAIHEDNPELCRGKERHLPLLTRAELLGQMMASYKNSIAIAGTHGKTTTTSIISQILIEAQADPTISIGGILNLVNDNTRIGHSDIFVIEACEYSNSFFHFFPRYSVVLNIEEDHLDFFKDLADIRHSFNHFLSNTHQEGMIILNGEIPNPTALLADISAPVLTYGFQPSDDYFGSQIHFEKNKLTSFHLTIRGEDQGEFFLNMPGLHNVSNALAAIAVTHSMGLDLSLIKAALSHCSGAKRRFEWKGSLKGITIIDDYAHHPTEITAALSAARSMEPSRLVCVFQPHTYTRTASLLQDFALALSHADLVILADIFPARETDTLGISSDLLRRELEKLGTEAYYFSSFFEIENYLLTTCINGDLLITMGAGDVVKIGENLLLN